MSDKPRDPKLEFMQALQDRDEEGDFNARRCVDLFTNLASAYKSLESANAYLQNNYAQAKADQKILRERLESAINERDDARAALEQTKQYWLKHMDQTGNMELSAARAFLDQERAKSFQLQKDLDEVRTALAMEKERIQNARFYQDLRAERAKSAKLVEALQQICDDIDADTHVPKRAIAKAALVEYESLSKDNNKTVLSIEHKDFPTERIKPTFDQLYSEWMASNGSRSPSIKTALAWMFKMLEASDNTIKSGDET